MEFSYRIVIPWPSDSTNDIWKQAKTGLRPPTWYNTIMAPKKTPADYHALAEKRGFRWLGPEVPNVRTKTWWECEHGHRWEAVYSNIRQGYGCPDCAGVRPKTPKDYLALAERRGFRWLGPKVPNTSTNTVWECENGHQWNARFGDIQNGSGCPACAGNLPKVPADYHALAEERGFRWIGPEVQSTHTKTGWACEMAHQWEVAYHSIQQGRGCPICAIEQRAEERRTKPDAYHALAEYRGFRWLGPEVPNNSTRTEWECEHCHRWKTTYSSIQQGKGCPFCAGKAPKSPTDYHTLAAGRGFRWLGPEVLNVGVGTIWECEHGHRWEAAYSTIQQGRGCPFCAGLAPKTPDDFHELAEERGIRWLGPEVSNNHTRTEWECEHGHRWKTTYNRIQQGTGCPNCAIQRRAEKWRIKPDDYHALAAERGFRWLGPEVPGVVVKTVWQCENGHRWEAHFSSIQNGSGCPFCAGLAPKTLDDYHSLAEERGFEWLGPEVPNIQSKTIWRCQNGHQWEAHYNSIHQGSGCPVCLDLVHGTQVSQVQRSLCEILNGELNRPFERYNIDIALEHSGVPIAVEYDAWYWHAGREEDDTRRDDEMIAAGWRVLRVRSNTQLPTREQLDAAIDRLLAGEQRVEIVLDDWGVGPTRFETD
jgi:very-short-patch-repair endonuclease